MRWGENREKQLKRECVKSKMKEKERSCSSWKAKEQLEQHRVPEIALCQ